MGTLEDSFSSSEQVLSSSPASPGVTATLRAERGRRQQLLCQLTKVCALGLVHAASLLMPDEGARGASWSWQWLVLEPACLCLRALSRAFPAAFILGQQQHRVRRRSKCIGLRRVGVVHGFRVHDREQHRRRVAWSQR